MGELNRAWALDVLRDYVWASTKVPNGQTTAGGNPKKDYPVDADELHMRLHVAQQVIRRVLPESQGRSDFWSRNFDWTKTLALKAIAQLEREEELRRNLGEESPTLIPGELHTWVWEGAPQYWRIGAYNAAITQALIRLNAELQRKMGRKDVGEGAAFTQAFSLDSPQPGKPRLRLREDDGGRSFDNVHRGVMYLGQALYAGVRNPLNHDTSDEPSEQEALETMAAISLLARWTDRAELEFVDA